MAVRAVGGAGTALKLVNNCSPDIPDCTWSYRDGMLLSDTDPRLAVTAGNHAGQLDTALKLMGNCRSNFPDCTWTYRKGMLISDADPSLAVTAVGGAGTALKLVNNCSPEFPDCTWSYRDVRLFSDTNPSMAIAPMGVGDGSVLRLDNMICLPFGCTWTYRQGMLLSDRDPSLAVTAVGGDGTALKLVNNCRPEIPHCTWTYRQGMLLSDSNPSLAVFAYGGTEGTRVDELLGGPIGGAPAAVSRGNRIDVFVQSTDNRLLTKSWDGSTWTNYLELGPEQIGGAPAAVSRGPNRLDVFVRGTDGRLLTKSWDGSTWTNYLELGPELILDRPAAVSRGNRIDVFVQGTDNRLYMKSWDGSTWTNYIPLGTEQIADSPTAVSRGDYLHVFVRGTDNRLHAKSWDGSTWTNYPELGPELIANTLAAVSWGNRFDVFVLAAGLRLYKKSWNGSSWATTYEPLGQDIFHVRPAVVSWGPNRIDVFFQGVYDQSLHMKSWNGTKLMLANNCAPHNPGCTWNPHPAQLIRLDLVRFEPSTGEFYPSGGVMVCDFIANVCGLSDLVKQTIMVTGRGTCGSFGIKWGDGDAEEIRGWNFDRSQWIGEHMYKGPLGILPWPGPKIIHAFAMANCTGETKLPVDVLLSDSVGNQAVGRSVFSIGWVQPFPKACGRVLIARPVRKGATVTLSQLPSKTMINFGCWFNGCTNDADGNSGATTQSYPFPSMRRHSLVLRIVQDGPGGGVQVVQGGTSARFVVQQNGPLEFCQNDSIVTDNTGGWGIGVSVDETKVP